MREGLRLWVGVIATLASVMVPATAFGAAGPKPGTPEYIQRDNQNIADAYGRQTAPDGQVGNPAYLPALAIKGNEVGLTQLAQQAASPSPVALPLVLVFPGWNAGNPSWRGWTGRRGIRTADTWTNRRLAL